MAEFLLLKKGIFFNFTLTLIASFFLVTTGWGQTVTTDKDDYSPGMYVIVTGTGWTPGETVSFDFHETPQVCSSDHHIRSTVAKVDGTILYDQFLINERHLGVAFILTATGQSSGYTALTEFTDAGIRNVNVGGTSFCAGQSIIINFEAVSANLGANGQFPNTADFYAELSDASGLFSSPVLIGNLMNTGESGDRSINATIPNNSLSGSGYKVRVRSEQPITNTVVYGFSLTINSNPTVANAGADQLELTGISTVLAANAPTQGTGAWSIISGTGGSLDSASSPSSTFTGTAGTTYILRWTTSNGACTSTDDMTISFSNTIATSTSLSSSLNPSVFAQSVIFTATVAPTNGANIPTGNVIFKNGTATLGTVPLATINNAQRATFTTTALAVNTSGHSISAVYQGADNFQTSTSSAINQIVNKGESTIVATGSTTFTYSGNAQSPSTSDVTGSTGSVSYSYSGTSNGGDAYAASSTAPTLAGSYSVVATVAADDNYNGKSSEALDFIIGKADQLITVTTSSPSSAVFNTGFTVAASATSGLAVAYSSDAPLSNVGADYTMNSGIGTALVRYNQAGDDNYNAAPEVTANVAAEKSESTIVATGSTTFTYSGSAQGPSTSDVTGSTGSVSYSYSGTSNGGVAYAASSTAPTLAGGYSVVAIVAADDNYNGKSSEALDFTIGKANQLITVTTSSPSSAVFNTAFTVAASATSGLAVAYSSSAPLSNIGADYTMNSGIGTGMIRYNQAGDDNYNAAPEVTANVAAAKAESTIVAIGTTTFIYNGSAQGPSTSDVTGSTGVVNYSYSGISNGSVAYGPSATKPTLAGSYSLIASVAADDNYNGKSSEALDFTIGKANQTIAVTTASPSSAVYNTGFTVAATASSGLPVLYSSSAPLSNVGADYTMNSGIGTGMVRYHQPGDDNYNPAPEVTANVAAAKANQSITVTTASPSSAVFNTGFTVAATASSGLAVAYSSTSPLSNVGEDYTMNSGIGTGVVRYNQAGDDNYNAALEVTAYVAAAKAESTIVATGSTTFTYSGSAQGPSTSDVTGSTGAVTNSYSGTSNGDVFYGPSATAPTLAGTYSVTASLAGDANYNGATSVPLKFVIGKAPLTITAKPSTKYAGQKNPTFEVTYSGFVNNEDQTKLSGTLAFATGADTTTCAGEIDVTPSGLTSSNYEIGFNSGKLTINPVTIDARYSNTSVSINTAAGVTLSATVSSIVPGNIKGILVTFKVDGVTVGTGETNESGVATYTYTSLSTTAVKEITTVVGNNCAKDNAYLSIYDPNGGFVTGGGWIESPKGASKLYPAAEGRANFGFNAKYKTGKTNATEVDGNTNFQFKAGDLHFSSVLHTAMSLVISGPKATYTGEGTINGVGNYEFRLIAIDGDLIGSTTKDKFRIKIWTKGNPSDVVYDNERVASESADATTDISGGSIVIHKPKAGGTKQAEITEKTSTITIAVAEEPITVDILESLAMAPNPVKTDAKVRFSLLENANVTVRLFDFNGREIYNLYSGSAIAKQVYEVGFQRNNLMSGIYIVRLTTDRGNSYTKQVIVE